MVTSMPHSPVAPKIPEQYTDRLGPTFRFCCNWATGLFSRDTLAAKQWPKSKQRVANYHKKNDCNNWIICITSLKKKKYWSIPNPHRTKIELHFLLIPDEQVLLFKGPNPLQSTLWSGSALSPPPLFTVWVFHLYFFRFLTFLDCGQTNKSLQPRMSSGNLHEENHLRNRSFHHHHPAPPPLALKKMFDCAGLQTQWWLGTWPSAYSYYFFFLLFFLENGKSDTNIKQPHPSRPWSYIKQTNNTPVLCLQCVSMSARRQRKIHLTRSRTAVQIRTLC